MQIKVNTYVNQKWYDDDETTCESSFLLERIVSFNRVKRRIAIGNGRYKENECCTIRFDNNNALILKETFEEVSKLIEEAYQKREKK